MRVYISADIEGVTGLVSWSQCGRPDGQHYDWPFARRMMLHDVNSAVRGARAAGATQVVVKDSHGCMKNLLIDDLEPGVELISGTGSGFQGMMEGIGDGFDAAMLIGYHAMAGTLHGIMEHTYTGGCHRLRINGQPAGEIALSAGLAGEFGVPVVTVSSDEAGCAEASALIPGLSTFVTKFGFGRYMGRLLHPSETGPGIEAAAAAGVSGASTATLWRPAVPITISIEFNRSEDADSCAGRLGVRRVDAYTCEQTFDSFKDAYPGAISMLVTGSLGANADR